MALVEINWRPSDRELKPFSRVWFPLFYVAVGAMAWWKYSAPGVAWSVWGIGVGLSLAGAALPAITRWIFVGMSVVFYPLGWTVSHLLLGLIFYGVVTPIGLLLRLFGHDPLRRSFDPDVKTYWTQHQPTADTRRYFKQY